MANLNEFDANQVMLSLSRFAPFALISCALLSFFAVGFFCVDYYEELFKERFDDAARPLAIMVALIQELVRFALLIASVRDFSDKRAFNGWLGLAGSVALVIHDAGIAKEVATMWSKQNPDQYAGIFLFLIFVGALLEIRLILTVNGASLGKPKKAARYERNGSLQTA